MIQALIVKNLRTEIAEHFSAFRRGDATEGSDLGLAKYPATGARLYRQIGDTAACGRIRLSQP